MGAFLTNVQVHTAGRPASEIHPEVVAAIRAWMLSQRFAEASASSSGSAPDRMIVIGAPGRHPWIAVYDERTESQDESALVELANVLSGALQTVALGILVHDSDVLELRLSSNGRHADQYSSDPDYFEKVSRKRRQELTGHPERWVELLAADKTQKDLRAAWDERLLFAEDTLKRVAGVLNLDEQQCLIGFNDLPDDPATASFTRLSFRSEAAEAQKTPEPIEAVGPPALQATAHFGPRYEFSVGDILEHQITLHARNDGGTGRGVEVTVSGDAVAKDLITPTEIAAWSGTGNQSFLAEPDATEDGSAYVARFPDFELPAGIVQPSDTSGVLPALGAVLAKNSKLASDIRKLEMALVDSGVSKDAVRTLLFSIDPHLQRPASIVIDVRGRIAHTGEETLHVRVAPLANPSGWAGRPTTLHCTPTPRRALRACGPSPHTSLRLRTLENPRILFALIVMGADKVTSSRVAADAMEEWHAAITRDENGVYETVWTSDLEAAPRGGRLKATQIPGGRRWLEIRKHLESWEQFSAETGRRVDPPIRIIHGGGFSFEASSMAFSGREADDAPHLGLWLNVENADQAWIGGITDRLSVIVNRAVERGRGLQGWIARWDWAPESMEYTPYEQACGIVGSTTRSRAWCSRYLRGVSPRLGLGKS